MLFIPFGLRGLGAAPHVSIHGWPGRRSRMIISPIPIQRAPMSRSVSARWIACALAIAAVTPARHLSAQTAAADSIPTVDASQLPGVHLTVVNQDGVGRALARQAAHIGNVASATVRVSFVIDENGRTRDVHADPTSGFEGVDRAAEAVVKEMRFTAPDKDGHPVRVRITMPISFTATPG